MKRDYPLSLQSKDNTVPTRLVLHFSLTEEDITKFVSKVGASNNGSLSIEIVFNQNSRRIGYTIGVLEKKGKGAVSYKEKIDLVVEFLVNSIYFQYIPAVRTENQSMAILRDMVSEELSNIQDSEYSNAIDVVRKKQEELMRRISQQVSERIKVFLPSIRNAEIILSESIRRYMRNDIGFFVDDGNRTNLSYKGEGIKSLVTLALLNSIANKDISRIVAIEEPESHLHPEAIHQIQNVIQSISENSQVIITTHNGVFVNRTDISSNIIVDNGVCDRATSLKQIRELLGIQLSDNLVASEIVVIVEGEDDALSLKSVLRQLSSKIDNAIRNKKLDFTSLGGATNLKYKCSLYASLMCKYYVIVDGDECGRASLQEAVQKGLVTYKNLAVLNAYGEKKESEFEDFLKKDLYAKMLIDDYGVEINSSAFKGNKKKWSERLKRTFLDQCKPFDDKIEAEIKSKIATLISESKVESIFPEYCLNTMKSIALQIENLI